MKGWRAWGVEGVSLAASDGEVDDDEDDDEDNDHDDDDDDETRIMG